MIHRCKSLAVTETNRRVYVQLLYNVCKCTYEMRCIKVKWRSNIKTKPSAADDSLQVCKKLYYNIVQYTIKYTSL